MTGIKHASLYFQQWYDLEDGDKGYVEISEVGGAAWQSLAAYPKPTYNTNHPKRFWYMDEIDIGKYAGKKVHIRFRLKTGEASLAKGWYLDDIQVRDTPPVKTFIPAGAGIKPADEAGMGAADKEERVTERDAAEEAPAAPSLSAWRSMNQEKASFMAADGEEKPSSGLPATATITIVDTDRSTKTDSGTGRYRLKHPPGTFKMRVEAYGYHTVERTVTIIDQERTEANIHLQPLSSATISGVITDKATGEPIAGAAVRVREDSHVPSAVTDEQGTTRWRCMQEITHCSSLRAGICLMSSRSVQKGLSRTRLHCNLSAGRRTNWLTIGEGDNAVAFYDSGNGYAVRMTSDGPAQVTGARMFFWDEDWPVPGGTALRYALYDASGPGGQPGEPALRPARGNGPPGRGMDRSFFSERSVRGRRFLCSVYSGRLLS